MLGVRVVAPPVKGKANDALERILAKAVGVPKSHVRLISGRRGRKKTMAIDGVNEAEVRRLIRESMKS